MLVAYSDAKTLWGKTVCTQMPGLSGVLCTCSRWKGMERGLSSEFSEGKLRHGELTCLDHQVSMQGFEGRFVRTPARHPP